MDMGIVVELAPELEARLQSEASQTGLSLPEYLRRLIESTTENGHAAEQPAEPAQSRNTIDEIFDNAIRNIPREELLKIPTDLADQVDHYVYGTPKKPR
jgi:hypothetical protein